MASIAHCDTHVALWLYSGDTGRFSRKATEALESHDLLASPMVRLEMQFLHEVERIKEKPELIFRTLAADFGMGVCNDPFASVVEAAEAVHWTRDPFDRLVVAQAMLTHSPLITKDDVIRRHYKNCIW
jgi:PIN domain nuclease of toxin-antitoxin system